MSLFRFSTPMNSLSVTRYARKLLMRETCSFLGALSDFDAKGLKCKLKE